MQKMLLNRILKTSKFLLFACFIALLAQGVKAQSWKMEDYAGIPSKDMHNILHDKFENDANMWTERSAKLQCSMLPAQGIIIKSFQEDGVYKYMAINFNPKKNFQVEGSLKWAKAGSTAPIGITFGITEMGDSYEFLISQDGTFSIIEVAKGRSKAIQTQIPSADILKDNYNSLMVRKAGGKWFFFINKNLVFECQAQDFSDKNVGFVVKGKTNVYANSFAVYELISSDISKPLLFIMSPEQGDRANLLKCGERNPIVKGRTNDVSGIKEVRINDIPVPVLAGGIFSYTLSMKEKEEYMDVKIEVMDNNGNIASKTFTLHYVSGFQKSNAVPVETPIAITQDDKVDKNEMLGPKLNKNYAIFIGINNYDYWMDLNNTILDCRAVSRVLLEKYDFDMSRMVFLYNERATRSGILSVLDSIGSKLTTNDNLLIYYAGHGFYDSTKVEGYWVPKDGQSEKPYTYVSNTEILASIRGIKAQHTFLIADACFSGSIFVRGTSKPDEVSKSRWAFTSGDIEYVEDGVPGKNSPFATYLIQELVNNPRPAIRADDLIRAVTEKVVHNASQTPRGMPMKNVGDEGGVFVFRKKKGQ
jgi:hypothetical protein